MLVSHGVAGRTPRFAEIIADGCVHAVGVAAAMFGVGLLIGLAASANAGGEFGALLVYGGALILMLGCSAAYNMTSPSRLKGWLRRFDHSAIFVMIAGTYTPFVTQLRDAGLSFGLGATVWTGALGGVALKVLAPGRFDRLSVLLYLGLGWLVVIALGPLAEAVPRPALVLLLAGGVIYSAGVIFHLWESLPFQNAIWHAFVLVAATCHYGAVLDCMVLARG